MTTVSKVLLSLALPAVFTFTVVSGEWWGGAVTLAGMAIALTGGRSQASPG